MHSETSGSPDRCQYRYQDLLESTSQDERYGARLRKAWWRLTRYVCYVRILRVRTFVLRVGSACLRKNIHSGRSATTSSNSNAEALNLRPGEWVEIRTIREIRATLDWDAKRNGLRFIPEMSKYCGKRFKVYKILNRIVLETTGELRTIRTPTVLLDGVICDGRLHGGCDRSCFCFWREAWLRRTTG